MTSSADNFLTVELVDIIVKTTISEKQNGEDGSKVQGQACTRQSTIGEESWRTSRYRTGPQSVLANVNIVIGL